MQFGSKKQSRLKPNDGELLWGFGLGNESVIMIMSAVQNVSKCYQISTDGDMKYWSWVKIILICYMNLEDAFIQIDLHCTYAFDQLICALYIYR